MKAIEIRNRFLKFFKEHNHSIIPSASVVPKDDDSVLFITAGMQPLVPYLLGKKHEKGNMLSDYQKCIRTVDIDEVGDNRHLTFFEMLGNWSLGAYFKEESIKMSYELLTKYLEIPKEKLSVTCFKGDEDCPKDEVSAKIWKECGIPEERIYFFGKDDNWWIAGDSGPCGPDTEIFYDTGKKPCSDKCNPSCDCGKYIEIWNNVFMEYFKDENGYRQLSQKNVDTGMGLERIAMLLQGKETPFDLEMFKPAMDFMMENSSNDIIESRRIVAEHLRSSSIIIADGVYPSNVGRGYILRRLLRRSIRHMMKMCLIKEEYNKLIEIIIDSSSMLYPELEENKEKIQKVILEEITKFSKTLERGEKELQKLINKYSEKIPEEEVFKLYETHGLPTDISIELLEEKGYVLDKERLKELFEKHQETSRKGMDKKFKGGLADHSEMSVKYHTATHLLHKALQEVLGKDATQKGSNITEERLRFDFAHEGKLTQEEIKKIEDLVNEKIAANLEVTKKEMTVQEAKEKGAMGLFEEKYAELDKVCVYMVGDFSMEICGGPHVKNTNEMGTFKIVKEEASSKGVRRIKAILI